MSDTPIIDELLEYTDDELYEELGAVLIGKGFGFADEDPGQFRHYGKKWFFANLATIRGRVCGNDKIQGLTTDAGGEAALGLVSAISEALNDMTGTHAGAAVLALIVMRYGLKKLCAGESPQV